MARVFITGSADGLGLMEARLLVAQGHQVVLHGRSRQRANEALSKVPGAMTAVVGDLASIAETKSLADRVNELGPFDAVIHNAGVYGEPHCIRTSDGLPQIFAVNSLAPYILTCLIRRPKRLVYTSSGLHRSGDSTLNDLTWRQPAMFGIERLLGFEAAHRHPCLCRCPQMARCIVQCHGARLGGHEDGRAGSSRQHRGRVEDAGVAGGEPGQGSPGLGRIFRIFRGCV